ncbi:MAG: hypothetical protein JXA21_01025 [Anaerolineae bacterium]|nr:hypothetical protein [Anaerolineae bacterium]
MGKIKSVAYALSRRVWRPWLFATLAYLVITIAVTYPVAGQLNTHIAGEVDGDSLEFVWSMWWWKHALFDLRQNPIDISVINHPEGIQFPLLPAMSQPFVLGLPLTALVSPGFAYNAVFLLAFVLSGLAGYLLCTELTGDPGAGFVGGLIWAFFPNMMGHALAGHLFFTLLFMIPLAARSFLRLLKEPTTRHAIVAGVMLALSATLHPTYLAYFIAIFVLVFVGHGVWAERGVFWQQGRLRALAIAAGVMGLIVGIMLAPALAQFLKGNLNFLAERGATGFAFDVLAYFLPAPNNPLVLKTPLAALAQKVVLSEYESIATIGWLPLVLAIAGAWKRWPQSRAWVILAAVGGVLALGPLLKIGGGLVRAPVEDDWYPLVMPYALIGRLPFFQWGRTPGRLDILVMLAVAVLAASGYDRISRWPKLGSKGRLLLLAGVTLFITVEYLIKFPFPTIPAGTPEPLLAIRSGDADLAVIDLPVPDKYANLRSLYWQTLHEHPLVGGRVYRDIPNGQMTHTFLSRLLLSTGAADIVRLPTDGQRLAALNALRVGWVLYDAQADPDATARATLGDRLGEPAGTAPELAVFNVPPAELRPDDLIWTVGDGWYTPQDWNGQPGRWFNKLGRVYLFSGSEYNGQLAFTAVPGLSLRRLTVRVNGAPVGRFAAGDWMEYHTGAITINRGLNVVEFVDEGGATNYVGDPRCAGGSPVSGPYPIPVQCDSADRTTRGLSLAILNLRLIPETEMLPIKPAGMQFGDAMELVGFSAPDALKAGENPTLHLVWRSLARTSEDLTVFVHLLNGDNVVVAQDDAGPVGGTYPSSDWREGEIVAYNVTLRLPADLAPGPYHVQLGLYRWPSLERLPVSGPLPAQDNVVRIGEIAIQ